MNVGEAKVLAPGYAEAVDILVDRADEVRRTLPERHGVPSVMTRHDLKQRGRVPDRPCDRPVLREDVRHRRAVDAGVAGDSALRRLDAVHAAEVGRYAYRPSTVAARRYRAQVRRDSRSRTAAGASGRAVSVPRVPPRLAQPVLAGADHPLLRCVRLSQDDRPGALDPFHHRGVSLRHVVLEQQRPHGGPDPSRVRRVLDRDGQTVQRAQLVSPDDGRLRLPWPPPSPSPWSAAGTNSAADRACRCARSRARSALPARHVHSRSAPPARSPNNRPALHLPS